MALSKIDAANFLTGTIPSGNIATSSLAAAATGKVLQVKNAAATTKQSSSSTSFADVSGLSVSITPASSSNKILVVVNCNMLSNAGGSACFVKLLRDSTVVTKTTTSGANATAEVYASGGGQTSGADRYNTNPAISFLDSPSSTSALTYKIQFATSNASNAAYINGWALNDDQSGVSTITVMEISA